ncbi:MAG: hypothetical protein ACR2O4_11115 [Hyphomicrobiaceae bacterium]
MRKLLIAIAVLVAAKLGYEQLIYRSATYEVIVGTYAQAAIKACTKGSKDRQVSEALWSKPASVKLVIGKSDLDVYFWQVNHLMWRARYKNPYLFITTRNAPDYLLCEYDILRQSAFVQQM